MRTYDAIVIGSGISGGWAAKELTERGLRVICLEAGRPDHARRRLRRARPALGAALSRLGRPQALERDQPVQRQCYACDEWSSKFFVNDLENPYSTDPDTAVHLDPRPPGGRAAPSPGAGRSTAGATSTSRPTRGRRRRGLADPLRRHRAVVHYVERFIGVSGQAEGLSQLPDGEFLPPMADELRRAACPDAMARTWGGNGSSPSAAAPSSLATINGRKACHYCGPCERGCITRPTSVRSTAPSRARAPPGGSPSGRTAWWPRFSSTRRSGKATGVRVIDALSRESLEIRAASSSSAPRRSSPPASCSTRRARSSPRGWAPPAASWAGT